jgi:hypothetical protein
MMATLYSFIKAQMIQQAPQIIEINVCMDLVKSHLTNTLLCTVKPLIPLIL